VLGGEKGAGIDFKYLKELCAEVAAVKRLGVEIVIVVGGGNFWRYRDFKDSGLDRVHSDYMGMLATVMNSMAMANAFNRWVLKPGNVGDPNAGGFGLRTSGIRLWMSLKKKL